MPRLLRPIRRALAARRRAALERAWHEARLTLGSRMYAAGIDDGVLGQQLARLDEQLRRAGRPVPDLEAARTALLLGLADLALEDDAPLPGAEAEYCRAREAQTRLEQELALRPQAAGAAG